MQTPLQVTFRNIEKSESVEARIRERVEKLEHFYDGIIGCRVVVEELHQHHRKGNHFHVRVEVSVPDAELVASREPDEHHRYTDVYVAIRDGFDAVGRQLEDYARRHDRRVKAHAVPPHGRISELNPAEGYGRITTLDGRLIYFHRNSVVEADFDRLQVGAEVRFAEEAGELGPQASTVHLIGKHHVVG
jgi:ribosomal subunit interface protein